VVEDAGVVLMQMNGKPMKESFEINGIFEKDFS